MVAGLAVATGCIFFSQVAVTLNAGIGLWVTHRYRAELPQARALMLRGWLVLAAALMALRMGLTAALPMVLPLLLLAQALHAITFAAHHTVCIALLSHHFPGRLRGRGQALYTVIAYGFPGVIGALLGGLLSEHWGLRSVFVVSVLTSAVATAAAYKVWRLQHPRLP